MLNIDISNGRSFEQAEADALREIDEEIASVNVSLEGLTERYQESKQNIKTKKESKKERRQMKTFERAQMVAVVFKGGVKKQLTQADTLEASAVVGIYQGLKYGGNVRRGIKGAAMVAGGLAAVNGVINVVENWDAIKEATSKDED